MSDMALSRVRQGLFRDFFVHESMGPLPTVFLLQPWIVSEAAGEALGVAGEEHGARRNYLLHQVHSPAITGNHAVRGGSSLMPIAMGLKS